MTQQLPYELLRSSFTFLNRKQLLALQGNASQSVNSLIEHEFSNTSLPYLVIVNLRFIAKALMFRIDKKSKWVTPEGQNNIFASITKSKYLRALETTIFLDSSMSLEVLESICHIWSDQNLRFRSIMGNVTCNIASPELFQLISTSRGELHLEFTGSVSILNQHFVSNNRYDEIYIEDHLVDCYSEFPCLDKITDFLFSSHFGAPKKNLRVTVSCASGNIQYHRQILIAVQKRFICATERFNFFFAFEHLGILSNELVRNETIVNAQTKQYLICSCRTTQMILKTFDVSE